MVGDILKNKTEQKSGAVKSFNCPSCGASVLIRAVGHSVTVVCGSCTAIIDSSNENFKQIDIAFKKGYRQQVIPLGQRGKLHSVLWEVIGYMERVDGSGYYSWSEYLLFNPIQGFRWLTEFDGHWNYVLTTKSIPEVTSGSLISNSGRILAKYLDKKYFLFHQGKAKVTYVIGEFYWQVKIDETVYVEDYVLPPEILSCERNNSEVIWSIGQYIDAGDIKAAFKITDPMPLQTGVAPNQPSRSTHIFDGIKKHWMLFLAIIFVLQVVYAKTVKNQTIYSGEFTYSPTDSEKLKVTPPFEIAHGVKNLEINLVSRIQNSWIEIQGSLINDDDGSTIDFEQGVEFYSGSDSDGYWTEGKQHSNKILSSIPNGKYHLNLEAKSGKLENVSYYIQVKRDVVSHSNFLWALVLICFYPFLVWIRSWAFEYSRWSQSDFSPYSLHQEDDEE
jgi:hypothetical protein